MSLAAFDPIPFCRRMSRRDPSSKPKACRNLFGTPDPDEVNQFLANELRTFDEEYLRKYNFDLNSDSPIEGKYEWESCDPQDIPAFYRPVTVTSHKKSLPERTPSMPSIASEAAPVSVQSTSVDATVIENLHARLHRDSSDSSSSSNSPDRTDSHENSKTSSATVIPTKSVKRNFQSSDDQPKITDFLRVRKRSSSIDVSVARSVHIKRRKKDQTSSTTTQNSAESIATSSS